MAGNDGRCVPIHDVVRGIDKGIDPSTPWTVNAVTVRRQLEVEGLPIRVEDDVDAHTLRHQLRGEGEAVRGRAPVGLVELDSVPRDVGLPDELAQSQPLALGLDVSEDSVNVQHGDES